MDQVIEVIEAMARAMFAVEYPPRHYGALALWDEAPNYVRGLFIRKATAAYNAMRETLVPVVMMHDHNEHLTEFERYRHGAGCLTGGDKAAGWTETPLYSLPEIDNG